MAATTKPVRRLSKAMGESVRKSHPISLKSSPKSIIKKHSNETRKSLAGLGKKKVIKKEMNKIRKNG
jgi:hypothetical protein